MPGQQFDKLFFRDGALSARALRQLAREAERRAKVYPQSQPFIDCGAGLADLPGVPQMLDSLTIGSGNGGSGSDGTGGGGNGGGGDGLTVNTSINFGTTYQTLTNSTYNDYLLPDTPKVAFALAANATITGFAGGTTGRQIYLWNTGAGVLSLANQSAASAAANRIIVPTGATYSLQPNDAVILQYDGQALRWRLDHPTFAVGSTAAISTQACRWLKAGGGLTSTDNGDGSNTLSVNANAVPGTKDFFYWRNVGTTPIERWYVAGMCTAGPLSNGGLSALSIDAMPFVTPRAITLDRIAVYVFAGVAAAIGRVGIYQSTSDTDLYPNSLILDSAVNTGSDLDFSVAGMKTALLNPTVSLSAGALYWLVVLASVAGVQVKTLNNTSPPGTASYPILGIDNAFSDNPGVGFTVAIPTYPATPSIAMPTPYPAGASIITGNNGQQPAIAVRLSA